MDTDIKRRDEQPFVRREIKCMTACPVGSNYRVFVVCTDGTMWELIDGQWYDLPAIPMATNPHFKPTGEDNGT